MSDYGREDRREARKWFGLGIFGWLIILVVAVLVAVAAWGFTVATSDIKGQGDGVIQNNSADNWIEAQAEFEQNFASIEADDIKITNAYAQLQAEPDNTVFRTNYTGIVSHCLSLVADYNADARSYLTEDWRAADLPERIETQGQFADVATDCKENTP